MFRNLTSSRILTIRLLRAGYFPHRKSQLHLNLALLSHKSTFSFAKTAASKLKLPKKYEESENDLNDIISTYDISDEEGVNLDENKNEWDMDITDAKDKELYHFIPEKDPARAALQLLQLQNFIMKVSEKLSRTNLRETSQPKK